MLAFTLAGFTLAPVLLFAPADPGVPTITAIFDRFDVSFASESSCPHGSSGVSATEMYAVDGTTPPQIARTQACDATSDDGFWQDGPREEELDGFWRGRPRQAMPQDPTLV